VATQVDPELIELVQSSVNDGQSPEQTHTPELSEHVEARAALVVQPRIVTRAKSLSFIVVVVVVVCYLLHMFVRRVVTIAVGTEEALEQYSTTFFMAKILILTGQISEPLRIASMQPMCVTVGQAIPI